MDASELPTALWTVARVTNNNDQSFVVVLTPAGWRSTNSGWLHKPARLAKFSVAIEVLARP